MFHDQPLEPAVVVHRKQKKDANIVADYKLHDVVEFLLEQRHLFEKVGVQFPDELLPDATMLLQTLQKMVEADSRYKVLQDAWKNGSLSSSCGESDDGGDTSSSLSAGTELKKLNSKKVLRDTCLDNPHRPKGRMQFFCLCDNTFGSCCPDEITAKHYDADCIIHFGPACMSHSSALPVFYVHPSFHFQAVPSSMRKIVEPLLVVDVLRRLKDLIGDACRKFSVKQRNNNHEHVFPASLAVELVVVGTHANKELMDEAEKLAESFHGVVEDEAIPHVRVSWSRYDQVGSQLLKDSAVSETNISCRGPSPALLAPEKACRTTANDSFPSSWNSNGVRFPMLPFSSHRGESCDSLVQNKSTNGNSTLDCYYGVQVFLFVGSSSSSHPLHLSGILQYNETHYDELQSDFIQTVCESVPLLTILDESFLSTLNPFLVESALSPVKKLIDDSICMDPLLALPNVRQCVNGIFGDDNDFLKDALESSAVLQSAQKNYQRRIKQRAFNVEIVKESSAVGILVVSLCIKGYYETTMRLQKLLRLHNKRSYIIYVGHLNEFKLANFVDCVDCFVAVACPNCRESHFPQKSDGFMKPVVSPAEVLIALAPAGEEENFYGLPAAFNTALEYIAKPLKEAIDEKMRKDEEKKHVSLSKKTEDENADHGENGENCEEFGASALVSSSRAVGMCCNSEGALCRLYERNYVGLNPRVGETAVQEKVLEGKDGVARGYKTERL